MGTAIRILITGFGPFPGVARNASADLVNNLAVSFRPPGIILGAAVLPVAWNDAIGLSQAAIDEFKPDAVIHFGVAKRCAGFEIETRAFNKSGPKPDYEGVIRGEGQLIPMKRQIAPSTLSAFALMSALTSAKLPTIVSKDAGRYLCNAVLYSTLQNAQHRAGMLNGAGMLTVFIHIPAFGAEGAVEPRLSFQDVVRGGEILLRRTVTLVKAQREADRARRTRRITDERKTNRISVRKYISVQLTA